MPPVSRRSSSRDSSSRSSGRSSSGRSSGSGSYRGEEGRRKAQEELERQKALAEARRNMPREPFRFYVPVGETKTAVILDDGPDFFRFEHNLKGADGKWRTFTGCVKENDNCPVCEKEGRESYYALYLTVLDFSEFETRDGETVEFSRKLLVVKPGQQKKFMRFFDKEGTLRGVEVEFTRDGDKDPSIGNDIEFLDFMDEDELSEYTREWTDKEKKKHVEDCSVPFDYEELYPEANVEDLRAMVGGKAPAGSRSERDRELGSERRRGRRGDDDDDQQEDRSSRRGSSRTSGRGRQEREERSERGSRRGREQSKDMEDWQDPDGEGGDPPWDENDGERQDEPKRGRGRTARGREAEPEEKEERTTRRGSSRRSREEPQDDDQQEERGSRRGRSSREAEPEPEPRRVRPRRGR